MLPGLFWFLFFYFCCCFCCCLATCQTQQHTTCGSHLCVSRLLYKQTHCVVALSLEWIIVKFDWQPKRQWGRDEQGKGHREEAPAGQQQQRVADVNSLYVFLWLSSRGAQTTNVHTHVQPTSVCVLVRVCAYVCISSNILATILLDTLTQFKLSQMHD